MEALILYHCTNDVKIPFRNRLDDRGYCFFDKIKYARKYLPSGAIFECEVTWHKVVALPIEGIEWTKENIDKHIAVKGIKVSWENLDTVKYASSKENPKHCYCYIVHDIKNIKIIKTH